MLQVGNVTSASLDSDFLAKRLAVAEARLSKKEKQIRRLEDEQSGLYNEGGEDLGQSDKVARGDESESIEISRRIARIDEESRSLSLAIDVAEWRKGAASESSSDGTGIFDDVRLLNELAALMNKHVEDEQVKSWIYPDLYIPLHRYVREALVEKAKLELMSRKYPSKKACEGLIRECKKQGDSDVFPRICQSMAQVQTGHRQIIEAVGDRSSLGAKSELLSMIFLPIFERIKFHFVETSSDRVTSSKIERLPEWLITYCRENLLEGGPYHFVVNGLAIYDDWLPAAFLNELTQLIRWVLAKRGFFRHEAIVGPRSSPMLLCAAIEQLLQYDSYLRSIVPATPDATKNLFSLVDLCVVNDVELMHWWLERERETFFSTLSEGSDGETKALVHRVSAKAEVFCASIRSVQHKAALLSSPELYLREVAVPLCMRFVDAVHETSTDLRQLLSQRGPINMSDLESNITEWIEVINGTRLAAKVLLKEGAWQDGQTPSSQSDHDLARFGRSLERLEGVLVEEFASSFVETVLMERAKLASYLMLASHLLASEEWDSDELELSSELRETQDILALFRRVCDGGIHEGDEAEEAGAGVSSAVVGSSGSIDVAGFALWQHVMDRLCDKFLEIALDSHGMVPDIHFVGASVFARDVQELMETSRADLPSVARLMDVARLICLNARECGTILSALGGLVGASTYLDLMDFEADGSVHDEAISMLRAKGFGQLDLADAVSILNRRRDLSSGIF